MKNEKHDFSLLSKPLPFRFNRLTLLANIVSLQFTEISEYQPSSSYRASKSRFFPYIHCKFCGVCPTTKMTSATLKPSIEVSLLALYAMDNIQSKLSECIVQIEIGSDNAKYSYIRYVALYISKVNFISMFLALLSNVWL